MPKGSGGKLAQFGSCWAGLDSRLRSVGILRPGRYLSISSRFFAGLQLLFFHAPVRLRRWLLLLTLLWRISMFATYLPNLSYLHKSLSTGQATYIEILMSMFWSLWTLLLLLLLVVVYFSILMIVIRRRVYVHVHWFHCTFSSAKGAGWRGWMHAYSNDQWFRSAFCIMVYHGYLT